MRVWPFHIECQPRLWVRQSSVTSKRNLIEVVLEAAVQRLEQCRISAVNNCAIVSVRQAFRVAGDLVVVKIFVIVRGMLQIWRRVTQVGLRSIYANLRTLPGAVFRVYGSFSSGVFLSRVFISGVFIEPFRSSDGVLTTK